MPRVRSGRFDRVGNLAYINRPETRYLISEIFGRGVYRHPMIAYQPGMTIVDAGANIGLFSLFAYEACGNDATIYACEPIPVTFDALQRNIELHHLAHAVHLFECALTAPGLGPTLNFRCYVNVVANSSYRPDDKERANHQPLRRIENAIALLEDSKPTLYRVAHALPFLKPSIAAHVNRKVRQATTFDCSARTLSDLIANEGIERIDLLKIDVEGAELDVLRGVTEADWSGIRQVVAEVHDLDGRCRDVKALLERQGFIVDLQANGLFQDPSPISFMLYAWST